MGKEKKQFNSGIIFGAVAVLALGGAVASGFITHKHIIQTIKGFVTSTSNTFTERLPIASITENTISETRFELPSTSSLTRKNVKFYSPYIVANNKVNYENDEYYVSGRAGFGFEFKLPKISSTLETFQSLLRGSENNEYIYVLDRQGNGTETRTSCADFSRAYFLIEQKNSQNLYETIAKVDGGEMWKSAIEAGRFEYRDPSNQKLYLLSGEYRITFSIPTKTFDQDLHVDKTSVDGCTYSVGLNNRDRDKGILLPRNYTSGTNPSYQLNIVGLSNPTSVINTESKVTLKGTEQILVTSNFAATKTYKVSVAKYNNLQDIFIPTYSALFSFNNNEASVPVIDLIKDSGRYLISVVDSDGLREVGSSAAEYSFVRGI